MNTTINVADLHAKLNERMRHIEAHKNEIIEAFVAKYGCDPTDAILHIPAFMQYEQRQSDGSFKWWISKMCPEEKIIRDIAASETELRHELITIEETEALTKYLRFLRWQKAQNKNNL